MYKNHEHYNDPTAGKAIKNAEKNCKGCNLKQSSFKKQHTYKIKEHTPKGIKS